MDVVLWVLFVCLFVGLWRLFRAEFNFNLIHYYINTWKLTFVMQSRQRPGGLWRCVYQPCPEVAVQQGM